jgi:hypothetical protein
MSDNESESSIDSIDKPVNQALGNHFLLQLYTLYGRDKNVLRISVPSVQMQLPGSNQCGPLVCAFMGEILSGKRPEGVIFVKGQQQRQWLSQVLEKEEFSACPRRKGPKPSNELTTPVNMEYNITAEASEEMRNHLVSLPNRPIFGYCA